MAALETGHFRARSLRFRLTLIYVIFIALMLSIGGILLRQSLSAIFRSQIADLLHEEYKSVTTYLRFENGSPVWFYDRRDPEESWTVDHVRRVIFIADANGNPVEISDSFRFLGIESPSEVAGIARDKKVVWKRRRTDSGVNYLLRLGTIEQNGRTWVVGIGRSLQESERVIHHFTGIYVALLPVIMVMGGGLSWLLAGRALGPVNDLAATAQQVSGSSLAMRIPPRGSGDELDALINAFNQMMERLEHTFQQTRQFSTDVSHELRTPLTTLRGQLEVALMTADTKEQYREAVVTALQEVERLTQVVRALLHLAQAESGRIELQRAPWNLAEVIRDITEQFEIPAHEVGITVVKPAPAEIIAWVDRVQIERMMSNLLANGLKYNRPGGSLEVRLTPYSETCVIEVQDSGVGIPPEHLPHIFNRFYRVPPGGTESSEKGLGLGLSFVAWIVKAHGGLIDVKSTPGLGTTFRVTLPLGAGKPRDAQRDRPAALQRA